MINTIERYHERIHNVRPSLIILFVFLSISGFAQELETRVSYLGLKLVQGRTLENRMSADSELYRILDSIFAVPGSFRTDLGQHPQISDLYPDDHAFRLISWGIPQENGEYLFNGLLLLPTDSQPIVHQLVDSSMNYYFEQKEIHGPDQWFGAMYYEIVHKRHKKKDHYFLLGWDGYSMSSNRKIIEPLQLDPKKGPLFGEAVFKLENKPVRIILEYAEDAGVSLRYDPGLKMIVYDHLVPMDGAPIGMFSFYIPDFTYEGLEFKKGKWIHHSLVQPKNDTPY